MNFGSFLKFLVVLSSKIKDIFYSTNLKIIFSKKNFKNMYDVNTVLQYLKQDFKFLNQKNAKNILKFILTN